MKKLFISLCILLSFTAAASDAADLLGTVREIALVKDFLETTKSEPLAVRDLGHIYEILARFDRGKGIFYVTKDGQYIMLGARVFNKEKKNITELRMREAERVDFSKLDVKNAIVYKKGTGAKKLIMVTDVDCPVCRRGHDWLKTQNNFTMYIFLYPLEMHPKARDKSIKVFCSKDPLQSIELAEKDKEIPVKNCDAGAKKLEAHMMFAESLNIGGTPLFVLGDGIVLNGFDQEALGEFLR